MRFINSALSNNVRYIHSKTKIRQLGSYKWDKSTQQSDRNGLFPTDSTFSRIMHGLTTYYAARPQGPQGWELTLTGPSEDGLQGSAQVVPFSPVSAWIQSNMVSPKHLPPKQGLDRKQSKSIYSEKSILLCVNVQLYLYKFYLSTPHRNQDSAERLPHTILGTQQQILDFKFKNTYVVCSSSTWTFSPIYLVFQLE